MKKLFLAINHCHSNGVVHRDLKPENIMYKESSKDGPGQGIDEVKIIDFGLSKLLANPSKNTMRTLVGTPYYVAPEVLEGTYGAECDCWSLGVIMYALLSGCLPFFGSSPIEVFDKIRKANVNFEYKEFKNISNSAKDLI
jgi:calcium-dependent protein kinase